MNRSIRRLGGVVCIFLAALMIAASGGAVHAQTFRGTILGTVTDSTGLAVSGATVTIKNTGTGLTRTVSTGDGGEYSVPELPIGVYSVTVEKSGFKTGVVNDIQVEVGSDRRADVSLQTGAITQRIEVSGDELPQVEATNNVLGGIIESRIVTSLPVNGRDYQKLIFLVPGVTGSPDQITDSPGSFGVFSVNGARGRANNFLLDGTDMNDGYRNDPAINEAGVFGTPATILPVEAIAELRVSSNFEAEYGRSAGAVINIVTKSGTNAFHGSGLEFFRNTKLNARNYFNPVSDAKQPFHDNQFGGSLGGPIVHDKTFFFVDYEAMRESGKEASPACVPTAADISNHAPTKGDLTSINPVIQNLLALNPWPTATSNNDCYENGGIPNAALATPFTNRVDSAIVKIDHAINKDNLLTGRYYIGDSLQSFPLALVGGGLLPNYNTITPTRVQLISLSYVTTVTPSVVSEVRLGWNRFAEGFFPQDRSFDPASIGLNTGVTKADFGLPVINVGSINGSSLAQLGADKGDPRQRVDSNWHFVDNISWKFGPNDIRFGYEFRRTSVSQTFDRRFRGVLKFDNLDTFLQGLPNGSSVQFAGDTDRNTFENSHAIYIQDSSRITRRFTLNLGLRYDYYGIISEKKHQFSNIDPVTGALIHPQGHLYAPDYNNWSPRVSFAWDLTGKGKTILRAGYGLFYDAFSQDLFMGHIPFGSFFAPGPAYSGFDNISQLSPRSTPFNPNVPVFAFPTPLQDAFGVDQNLRTPYMQNFNLNLQQELGKHTVFQIGYVGSNGHKLFRFRDINQPSQDRIDQIDLGCSCISSINSNRNFFNGLTYIYLQESSGNSTYNSLQTSLRVNNWHGLTSTVNYNWSHSIDDSSDGEDFVQNAAQPTDSTQPSSNRGNSNFDVRNRFTWNFIYEFPNRKGNWQRLTNGWGLNGILTVQSGQPFHLIFSEDDFDGSGQFFPKPDVVGPIVYHPRDPNNFLDLTAFAVPCTPVASGFDGTAGSCTPGTRHFGNLGRNSLIGPNFRQFDFSVFKITNITEKLKLELRLEAYNLLNRPNFANPYLPNFLADGGGNGFDAAGRAQGSLALGVTGDVGVGYPYLGSGGPRSLQLAAKFTF
ncbi:MAG TPA: TonB-dependent receptor [Candidatus Dormibacteraeota bacterium]|nr:TonB-dependent receptor [Candidatus Dormibacteraeota bacterium]